MGRLTTHVLDVTSGKPARGVHITLYARADDDSLARLAEAVTNAEGRCDAPLLEGNTFAKGRYRLVFAVGDYFVVQGVAVAKPPFLDEVAVDFGVADPAGHYHIPLLVSPWSYATYRGS